MKFAEYKRQIQTEFCRKATWRDVAVEFTSTFFLMSVQCALPLSWGEPASTGTVTQTGLGMAFVVATLIWTLGDMGGALMNPALTLAMALCAKITVTKAIVYVLVECLACVAGAAFVFWVTPEGSRGDLAMTSLAEGVTPTKGVCIEVWLTCFFILAVLGSVNVRRKHDLHMFTLPIGLAVGVCVFSGAKSTGASINPARSLGPALVLGRWDNHWVYWAGPMLGAALATFLYVVVFDLVDSDVKMGSIDKEVASAGDEKQNLSSTAEKQMLRDHADNNDTEA